MRLRKLTLRHFRNVGFAALEFRGRQHFLVGANGQGKTNLLEALYLAGTLRSFRAGKTQEMIRHGAQLAKVVASVDDAERWLGVR